MSQPLTKQTELIIKRLTVTETDFNSCIVDGRNIEANWIVQVAPYIAANVARKSDVIA